MDKKQKQMMMKRGDIIQRDLGSKDANKVGYHSMGGTGSLQGHLVRNINVPPGGHFKLDHQKNMSQTLTSLELDRLNQGVDFIASPNGLKYG